MRNRPDVRALSFDCYGTLVDWRRGVREAAALAPSLAGCDLDRLLVERERIDGEIVAGPYRPYRELLAESLVFAARAQRREAPRDEARAFAETMGDWPAFPDTRDALVRLASRYRLAIASNVESEVLARTLTHLRAPIEITVTAEDVRSYKPAPAHFRELLARLDLPAERVLHVSVVRFYDLDPAAALGFKTAWIARQDERWAPGEAPDLQARDLAELATKLGC